MSRARFWTTILLIALAHPGSPAIRAEEAEDRKAPTVLTIHPAGEPIPALKYRLVPERRELVPGNAAIFYHRANLMIATSGKDPKSDEKALEWSKGPAGSIPRDEARKYVDRFQQSLHEAELGAIRRDCDWEYDLRDEGFNLLLPEIQEIRQVARLIVLKARLEILDGRFDESIHWIQTGLAMGRHVSEAPFIIPGLVGNAIVLQIVQPFEDLIQTPRSPNLYWALATRPRPLIGMRRGLEYEMHWPERELPGLRDVDGTAWSPERAREFGDELFRKFSGVVAELGSLPTVAAPTAGTAAPRLQDMPSRLVLVGMTARVYPEAKRELIAAGRSKDEIEAMPALQVVLVHTLQEYRRLRDDGFKWTALPLWQIRGRAGRSWELYQASAAKFANPFLAMFTALMPAVENVLLANIRAERGLDALQCIEAIRMYAANHDGALPDDLDAMSDTPVPIDPATGKPFEYRKIDDATAILSASSLQNAPRMLQDMIYYKLKLAK